MSKKNMKKEHKRPKDSKGRNIGVRFFHSSGKSKNISKETSFDIKRIVCAVWPCAAIDTLF